jgi:hypothetical protein
MIYKEYGIMIE